jgi:DNA-binding Lrp family transcriptional regulator
MVLVRILLLDDIDKQILFCLGKNARASSSEIQKEFRSIGHQITERAALLHKSDISQLTLKSSIKR